MTITDDFDKPYKLFCVLVSRLCGQLGSCVVLSSGCSVNPPLGDACREKGRKTRGIKRRRILTKENQPLGLPNKNSGVLYKEEVRRNQASNSSLKSTLIVFLKVKEKITKNETQH